jgi:hypothetical protein
MFHNELGTSLPAPALPTGAAAQPAPHAVAEREIGRRLFTIRAADTAGERNSAAILVKKMYSARGYRTGPVSEAQSLDRATLIVHDRDEPIGTLSIGFDGARGLLVDELFRAEVDSLRARGLRLCEFIKLALDGVRAPSVLASLFHVAYIHAHVLKGMDGVVIEVNPRHVLYYQRMLGFEIIGPERMNRRVEAPAVLLHLDFRHAEREIARLAGQGKAAEGERSLYPHFFSPREQAGILARLRPAGEDRAAYH